MHLVCTSPIAFFFSLKLLFKPVRESQRWRGRTSPKIIELTQCVIFFKLVFLIILFECYVVLEHAYFPMESFRRKLTL